MTKCDFCGREIEKIRRSHRFFARSDYMTNKIINGGGYDIPFTCKYCGCTFCSDHRLPENHNCIGLPKERKDRESFSELFKSTFGIKILFALIVFGLIVVAFSEYPATLKFIDVFLSMTLPIQIICILILFILVYLCYRSMKTSSELSKYK